MNNLFFYSFLIIILLGIIISSISFPIILDYSNYDIKESSIYTSEQGFTWPIPDIYKISSYYGHRSSPTAYASSYHYGIDISAPENTYFLASISRKYYFCRF